ncbi:DUF3883 domain-containing protein [Corallococcus macrosporus]|uniref:Uncharacterized protein n=1 Tax=Myxococcus fulvus (strain ATCC BAA-855 / HW-1) TaxID=483219 RepID=F8CGT9_MYXFH|nr:DUF3883 domain-containing protein [Corallococcus macrosporus]AEI63648.1 hypothetical protein LILAB_08685 [Corallococcus macrosporus]
MSPSSSDIVELKEVGQVHHLTVTLHRLVRDYPKSLGIVKEFIQNADDGMAQRVELILDRRVHFDSSLPPVLAPLSGPALLVYNDRPFRDPEDFDNIRKIGASSKLHEESKTGRFGLGFNASYNVTDYPCLLSRDRFIVFDPHERLQPSDSARSSGFGYKLNEALWNQRPGLLRPLEAGGLGPGKTFYNGTLFRLPLRTDQAPLSHICEEPFTEADCHTIFQQLEEQGDALLLFLKHVLHVSVDEISPEGERRRLLSIETVNAENVEAERHKFRTALEHHAKGASAEAVVAYRHDLRVIGPHRRTLASWMVVSGLYSGPELHHAVEDMRQFGDKALPWAGAAAQLVSTDTGALTVQPIAGKLYCSLPLAATSSGFPVHIHGFFDVNSSRDGLTVDPSLIGRAGARTRWNRALLKHGVARAYAELLAALVRSIPALPAEALYQLFPEFGQGTADVLRGLPGDLYALAAQEPVIRCVGEHAPWGRLDQLRPPPPEWENRLQAPLRAQGLPIPVPPLPSHLVAGFRDARVPITYLRPSDLRQRLSTKQDVNTPLDQAPEPALRQREWVLSLLEFCREKRSNEKELVGLPLAILADGRLHTFGINLFFLAEPEERELLPVPHWFIEADFQEKAKLEASNPARLETLSPAVLIRNLKQASLVPNEEWLTHLYDYLVRKVAVLQPQALQPLKELALVPDATGHLHPGGGVETPLLLTEEQQQDTRLRHALEAFGIPVVGGSPQVLQAIRMFVQAYPRQLIRNLSGPTLTEALYLRRETWTRSLPRYDPALYDVILGVLSDRESLQQLTPQHHVLLRQLPLFPTREHHLVRLDTPFVYLPADQDPPPTASEVVLLRADPSWRALLSDLEVERLSHDKLIVKILLPSYAQLSAPHQLEALMWIRDNLELAHKRAEQASPERAADLKRALRAARLVRGNDGELHCASTLYHPREPLITNVLGATAIVPDICGTYRDTSEDWIAFFTRLGMEAAPKPQDLIAHIDRLMVQASSSGVQGSLDSLRPVYEYLDKRWTTLERAVVQDESTANVPLARALARRRWLPAQHSQEALSRYACALMQEDCLYAPRELYLPSQGHLMASQGPIALFREPCPEFRRALEMPDTVPLSVAMAHFDHLLARDADGTLDDIPDAALEGTLAELYTFFGRLMHRQVLGSSGSVQPAANELASLRAHYAERPCLWDPKRRRFWPPHHVFSTPVPFFKPYREHTRGDAYQDAGYTALGRRESPTEEDFLSFLEEVAASAQDEALPGAVSGQVLDVLRKLSLPLGPEGLSAASRARLQVLTQEGHLVPAAEVYRNDAPWYAEKLRPGTVHLVHSSVTVELLRAAKIHRLSEGIQERLATAPERSTNPGFITACARMANTLRSHEFIRGLRRLIQAAHDDCRPGDLQWLHVADIFPADRLDSQLLLAGRMVGYGPTDSYFDPPQRTLYLAQDNALHASTILAWALNHQLEENERLGDTTLALSAILDCEPSTIDSTLTRLKVPQLKEDEPSPTWEPPAAEELPADAPPVDDASVDALLDDEPLVDESPENRPSEDELPDFPTSPPANLPAVAGSGRPGRFLRVPPTAGAPSAPPFGSSGHASLRASPSPGVAAREASSQPNRTANAFSTPPPAPSGTPFIAPAPPRDSSPAPMDERPPTRPGHGHATGPRTGADSERMRRRAVTYVSFGSPATAGDGDNPSEAMEIGRAAQTRVVVHERAEEREPQEMPHEHPGYDIESRKGADLRFIEVKGMDGPWTEAGVALSTTQFETAQRHGEQYWLYVVEYARDDARFRIHPIQNPAGLVTEFRFDSGWKRLSSSATDSPDLRPNPGARVRLQDGTVCEILQVEGQEQLLLLHLRMANGTQLSMMYQPGQMEVLPEEE